MRRNLSNARGEGNPRRTRCGTLRAMARAAPSISSRDPSFPPLAGRAPRPYSPLMPDRVLLRYFDCLGRTQPLRNALVDAGIAFEDQRLAVGPSWRALKEQAAGGPFGSLPVLEWG